MYPLCGPMPFSKQDDNEKDDKRKKVTKHLPALQKNELRLQYTSFRKIMKQTFKKQKVRKLMLEITLQMKLIKLLRQKRVILVRLHHHRTVNLQKQLCRQNQLNKRTSFRTQPTVMITFTAKQTLHQFIFGIIGNRHGLLSLSIDMYVQSVYYLMAFASMEIQIIILDISYDWQQLRSDRKQSNCIT